MTRPKPRSKARRKLSIAGVVGIALIILLIWRWDSVMYYYYSRFRGGDAMREQIAREKQLDAIWHCLSEYKDVMGRFPASDEELFATVFCEKTILAAPDYSIHGDYVIWYALLNEECNEREILIVNDPGLSLPYYHVNEPEIDEYGYFTDFRQGLFSTGQVHLILPYDVECAKQKLAEMKQE